MQEQQIALVRRTWHSIEPHAAVVAKMFYERLFGLDRSLRTWFPSDMSEQKHKLMGTLAQVVSALDDMSILMPRLEALGRAHMRLGVETQHYQTVGSALLGTLEIGLAEDWTPEVEAAWKAAYTALAGAMQAATWQPAAHHH
jgi:hemoglobin-like flavoprotein